jgi:hypothetical protein
MRIAIIGTGNLGTALGVSWIARGHDIVFGVRDANGDARPSGVPARVRLVDVRTAAQGAEVVVLAVPAGAAESVVDAIGADSLHQTVLVDATNPISRGVRVAAGPNGESQAERLQARVPQARLVKALNQVGANVVAKPAFPMRVVSFVAGDDTGAKGTVLSLVGDLGFEGVDAGRLMRARELEELALLWISLAESRDVARAGVRVRSDAQVTRRSAIRQT